MNKNATGVSKGGSKILVVPFDGVQFDCDNGDPLGHDHLRPQRTTPVCSTKPFPGFESKTGIDHRHVTPVTDG